MKSMKNSPTYEEKLQALKESIEHWEKDIIPNPETEHFRGDDCPLCQLYKEYPDCGDCPISLADRDCQDDGSYWRKFTANHEKEDALAFVVFMKNLYIEMLEKRAEFRKEHKEWQELKKEKKEEWVDVTREIEWSIRVGHDGFYLIGKYDADMKVIVDKGGLQKNDDFETDIKIKYGESSNFRILKKI